MTGSTRSWLVCVALLGAVCLCSHAGAAQVDGPLSFLLRRPAASLPAASFPAAVATPPSGGAGGARPWHVAAIRVNAGSLDRPAPDVVRVNTSKFVRVDGTRFVLGCKQFMPVGWNSFTLLEQAAEVRAFLQLGCAAGLVVHWLCSCDTDCCSRRSCLSEATVSIIHRATAGPK